MDSPNSGGGKEFGRFTEPARRVLDLAREEAEQFGHSDLNPEHVVLGLLAEGQSGAAWALQVRGVDLPAARAALARLGNLGVVPAPRPSDTELLSAPGIDLDAVRHQTEQTFRRWSPSGPCSWPASIDGLPVAVGFGARTSTRGVP